ncbi:MAG: hypothetical protein IJ875_06145 [Solobacterium sp.]|nr:hypothetical protein [Solobacterium sp.]
MQELWLLTKTQLINQLLKTNSKKKSKLKIGSVAFTGIVLFGLSIYYYFIFMDAFGASVGKEVVPYLIALMSFFMTFIFGISSSQGMLFGFNDADFLRSLPIQEKNIVLSKALVFSLLEYFYSALLLLPAMIVFGIQNAMPFTYYVFVIIGYISFPILPMLVASFLGIFVKYISAGKKYANLIQNLGTIVFIGVIYFISFRFGYSSGSDDFTAIGDSIRNITQFVFPVKFYVDGALLPNIWYVIINTVLSFGLFYLFIHLYSKRIMKINEKASQGYHVENFQLKKATKNSAFGALLKLEWKKLFSNFTYLLNSAIGMAMLVIGSAYLCFFLPEQIKSLVNAIPYFGQDIFTIFWQVVLLIIFGFGQMTNITCVSLSLDAKVLWLIKSLPLSIHHIFISKIIVNMLLVCIPSLISLILFGITFAFPATYYVFGILFILFAALFTSCLGLLFNLLFPKLDYEREAMVVKQSLSAFLGVLIPTFLSIGIIFLYFYFLKNDIFYFIILSYALLDIILLTILYTYGYRRFHELNH